MSWRTKKKTIVLKSSEGECFEVEEAVAVRWHTIKHMMEDDCADSVIPVPTVSAATLARVIHYCKNHLRIEAAHHDEKALKDALRAFDANFLLVDQPTLFDLILAANFLDIKSLLDVTCEKVANMMRGKTPEEIRKTFNIKNDYTPEEEKEVRREIAWAFE